MGCVSSPNLLISLIEGQEEELKLQGALDKGPSLTFPFLLISGVVSSLLARLHEKGKFEGLVVGKDRVHVSILHFADDTLIFCKYDHVMLENLRKTIKFFDWCSGKMVNWESSALCGINIDDNKPYVEASRLNCKATFRWISQTILLLAAGDRKMQGKLEKWKRYNLSKRRLCHLV